MTLKKTNLSMLMWRVSVVGRWCLGTRERRMEVNKGSRKVYGLPRPPEVPRLVVPDKSLMSSTNYKNNNVCAFRSIELFYFVKENHILEAHSTHRPLLWQQG